MGKYTIELTDLAKKHLLLHKKAGNAATIKKIESILLELSLHPYSGTGKPEELKYDLKGYWSRRINQKDRLIYSVQEHKVTVEVISAMGHYDDK
jgi:toxin YoeB